MASLVSIIIPLYNGEMFIAETLQSALNQTYPWIEVIVIDDGSRDKGPDIVEKFPVQMIRQKNRGISAARNVGIKKAKGDFIALLDQDDLFKSHKIESQVAFLNNHPEYSLVFTPEERFGSDEPARRISSRHMKRKTKGDIFTDIYKSNYITPDSALVRRSVFDTTGLFDESLPICEDHDFFIRVSYHGLVGFIEEPLTEYRWHDKNTSKLWASKMPFVELELYNRYLLWLKERTPFWWWIYNTQSAKALRDMGIISLENKNQRDAVRYLQASWIRLPWRYKTIKYLIRALAYRMDVRKD